MTAPGSSAAQGSPWQNFCVAAHEGAALSECLAAEVPTSSGPRPQVLTGPAYLGLDPLEQLCLIASAARDRDDCLASLPLPPGHDPGNFRTTGAQIDAHPGELSPFERFCLLIATDQEHLDRCIDSVPEFFDFPEEDAVAFAAIFEGVQPVSKAPLGWAWSFAPPCEEDFDADGLCDDEDSCRAYASFAEGDADANGIGDDCECADQTRDGGVDLLDLFGVNDAILGLVAAEPTCDTNQDDACNLLDLFGVSDRILGAPAYCERDPSLTPIPGSADATYCCSKTQCTEVNPLTVCIDSIKYECDEETKTCEQTN